MGHCVRLCKDSQPLSPVVLQRERKQQEKSLPPFSRLSTDVASSLPSFCCLNPQPHLDRIRLGCYTLSQVRRAWVKMDFLGVCVSVCVGMCVNMDTITF